MPGWKIIIDGRRRYRPLDIAPQDSARRIDDAAAAELAQAIGPIAHQPVESASIASVGYDPQSCTLEVVFRNSGVYRYFDVPLHVYARLLAADSVGTFVNKEVKANYRFARM